MMNRSGHRYHEEPALKERNERARHTRKHIEKGGEGTNEEANMKKKISAPAHKYHQTTRLVVEWERSTKRPASCAYVGNAHLEERDGKLGEVVIFPTEGERAELALDIGGRIRRLKAVEVFCEHDCLFFGHTVRQGLSLAMAIMRGGVDQTTRTEKDAKVGFHWKPSLMGHMHDDLGTQK
jgi:hypothetical protein